MKEIIKPEVMYLVTGWATKIVSGIGFKLLISDGWGEEDKVLFKARNNNSYKLYKKYRSVFR